MGICASCLGLNRHPSQKRDETDALLDDNSQPQYGSLGGDNSEPDEEELMREREALDHITAEATEHMIDLSHPHSGDLSQHFAYTTHNRAQPSDISEHGAEGDNEVDTGEADEAAWLESIQSAGLDTPVNVEGLQPGTLVMDIGQLRESGGKVSKGTTQ